jgi:hypothetical protein
MATSICRIAGYFDPCVFGGQPFLDFIGGYVSRLLNNSDPISSFFFVVQGVGIMADIALILNR